MSWWKVTKAVSSLYLPRSRQVRSFPRGAIHSSFTPVTGQIFYVCTNIQESKVPRQTGNLRREDAPLWIRTAVSLRNGKRLQWELRRRHKPDHRQLPLNDCLFFLRESFRELHTQCPGQPECKPAAQPNRGSRDFGN